MPTGRIRRLYGKEKMLPRAPEGVCSASPNRCSRAFWESGRASCCAIVWRSFRRSKEWDTDSLVCH
eukprot:8496728-Prorocentrum_lima.AAC.1